MKKPKNDVTILNRIERLADCLNYESINVTITLKNKTLTLEKDKAKESGFR